MTRPRKGTVDFFPHVVRHGKTMTIIEQRFGNDGYAVWFKTLEMLGDTDGHALDLNDELSWEFFVTKMRVSGEKTLEILGLLSRLGAIDPELWSEKIIWSQNFVSNLAEVYSKRTTPLPARPSIRGENDSFRGENPGSRDGNPNDQDFTPPSGEFSPLTGGGNPQSREEKSREEKSKGEESKGEKDSQPEPPPSEESHGNSVTSHENKLPVTEIPEGAGLIPSSLIPESPILNPDTLEKNSQPEPPPPPPAPPPFRVKDLAQLWNEKAPPELSRVNLPFTRKESDLNKIRDAVKRHPTKEWWERVILMLYNLPFVRGENDRGWKITLDVMVRDAEKILDGKYVGKAPSRTGRNADVLNRFVNKGEPNG